MTDNAGAIARLSAEAMWAEDTLNRALGMAIESVGAGFAVLSMRVAADMLNGHGFCHGAYIFALADSAFGSAFGLACNSRNQRHVAHYCQISYIAPGRLGARLTAAAHECHRGERSGIYDVTVRADRGETIALFRGHSRAIPGTLVPP
jgi:acyl-CoA thioesterase